MEPRHLLVVFSLLASVSLLAPCAADAANADPAVLRGQLRLARDLIENGQADRALAPLKSVLETAAAGDLAAEEASAALLTARAQVAFGGGPPALKNLARAMRRSRDAGDAALSYRVALEASALARRLGADDQAMVYVLLAGEERAKLPRMKPLPPEPKRPDPPHELPFGIYSARSSIAAFRGRVKNDPEFLAGLKHLKEFRDDPAQTIVGSMDYPGVHVDQPRYFKDDYKTVSEALGYYKFVLRLGHTLSDEFALATLYVNMTVLRTNDHPALKIVYGATKGVALVEAATRIIGFHVTGGAMDLTILAFDKLVIDLIRKFEPNTKSVEQDLLGDEDDL